MRRPKRFEMDYHYKNIDPVIGDKIDEEINDMLTSSILAEIDRDEEGEDIRGDLAKQCAERIVGYYHQAILEASKVGSFSWPLHG